MERNNETELKAVANEKVEAVRARPRRRLNPVVKWVLIGTGAAIVIGGITFLIINGKKVPVKAVEKVAEVAADVAAAA